MSLPQNDQEVNWAMLDESNRQHYRSRLKPAFYQQALNQEQEYYRTYIAGYDRWLEKTRDVDLLYKHWQRLLFDAAQPCECEPDRMCRSCIARGCLNDGNYEPNLVELRKEME